MKAYLGKGLLALALGVVLVLGASGFVAGCEGCPTTQTCGPGFQFDPIQCSCVSDPSEGGSGADASGSGEAPLSDGADPGE